MALCFAAQQARDSDFKETQPSASFNAVIKPRWSVRRPPPFNTEVVIDSLLAEREPRWAFVVGGLFPPADKRTHLCPLALLLTAAAVGSCAGWQQQQKWGPWLGGPPLQDGHWGGIVTLLDPWGRSTSPHDLAPRGAGRWWWWWWHQGRAGPCPSSEACHAMPCHMDENT